MVKLRSEEDCCRNAHRMHSGGQSLHIARIAVQLGYSLNTKATARTVKTQQRDLNVSGGAESE